MQRLGVTEDEIRRARPHIDNSAYSHYMLCEAQAGDVLTGLVTLLNCSWSYAYIAQEMAARYPDALQNEHYGAWFAGYVSEEYRPGRIRRSIAGRRARRGHRRADDTASVRDLPNVLPV